MPADPDAANLRRETVISQLQAALSTIEWAVKLIPEGWTHRSPSGTRLTNEQGAWSVAMNLAHLTLYSERLPTSVLGSLLNGGDGVTDSWFREPSPYEATAAELAGKPLLEILARLRAAHAREVELANQFTDKQWTAPSTEAWGKFGYGPPLHSPARIVSKSFQHSWEHGNSILRIALYAPRDLVPD